jgi:hypothetical protein
LICVVAGRFEANGMSPGNCPNADVCARKDDDYR